MWLEKAPRIHERLKYTMNKCFKREEQAALSISG